MYTAHALSQLPSARHVIDALAEQADRITAVVNIEPMAPLYDDSLLGLMRRRYLEVNDYNRDLLDELRRRTEVEIVQTRPNIFGQNPFCPVSAVEWRFR